MACVSVIMDAMLKVGMTSYAEKHRLYEMFGNLVKALAMYQPNDPLKFIAWFLKHHLHKVVPKIILVAPPKLDVDKVHIVLNLAKITGAVTIDRRNVIRKQQSKRKEWPSDFVMSLVEYMRKKGAAKKGWILLGKICDQSDRIPNSGEEADRMISLGILPTHTVVLEYDDLNDDPRIKNDCILREYKKLEYNIKMQFRSTLKEICVHDESVDEITESCLEQILRQPFTGQLYVPKVTLIGPKGSGRFVTAQVISEKFDIVHVDFEQISVQKKFDCHSAIDDVPPETLRSWLKEKITTPECVGKGYVLTGFPRTRNDFEWLDSIEKAPNRVIFLAIDFRELYARMKNRCIDKNTGTFKTLDRAAEELKAGTIKFEQLSRHSLNFEQLFDDFTTYSNRLKEMLCYCGDDCSILSVDESLCNKISECITSGSPAVDCPRPQNRMPSRLTQSLNEKMLLLKYPDFCNVMLSEDAENLFNALKQKA